jgi:hypothetical protein
MNYFIERFIIILNKNTMVVVVSFVPLLPLFILFLRRKFINDFLLKLVCGYVIVDFIFNLVNIVQLIYIIKNVVYFNFFFLIEGIFWGLIAYILNPYKLKRIAIIVFSILLLIISFFDFSAVTLSNFMIAFSKFNIMIYSFFYFNTLLNEQKVKNLLIHPAFYINAGLLIYGMSSIILALFTDYIFHLDSTTNKYLFGILRIITILFFIFLSIAFWVSKYEKENLE